MKKTLLIVLVLMLVTLSTSVFAQDLSDPVGVVGDDRFSIGDLDAFADMDLSGEDIFIFGAFVETDADSFNNVLSYFNEVTGANAFYQGSGDFESQIIIDTEGGNPPDIAMFPQPGLMGEFAAAGNLAEIDNLEDFVREKMGDTWYDLGTAVGDDGEDHLYVLYYNVNMKSLVWYVPDLWEDFGYEVPTTWNEMIELSDTMVADGNTPWCIAIESSGASGWPATDWIEDIMLRMYPPDVYDAWVSHDIPFNDPQVVAAIEEFGRFAFTDGYVYGGPQNIVNTAFGDGPLGLFDEPANCFMHRQASFIPAFFPEDIVVGEDATAFYLPGMDDRGTGNPVLGAGNLTSVMQDPDLADGEVRPAVAALMDYLTTPFAHELWATQGSFLTPHADLNLDTYRDELARVQGEAIVNADVFRFDGSDSMPSAVGNGSFWVAMVNYISEAGAQTAQAAADIIEESWPME